MTDFITDHDHESEKRGPWRTPWCRVCGQSTFRHLSWGRQMAEMLGGEPVDRLHEEAMKRHLLAYSVGSTVGLVVGTLIGGPVLDEYRMIRSTRRRNR